MISKFKINTFLVALLAVAIGCTPEGEVKESSSLSPADPSALTTGTVTATTAGISWTDNSNDETGYEVQMCSTASCTNFVDVAASPLAAGATSHTQGSLSASTVYRFRVRAVNNFGASEWITTGDITTASNAAVANMCTSPSTQVVDFGVRAVTSTTLAVRGFYSSVAINPMTDNPAILFNETHTAGASALKIMFWNGTEYKYETIASGVVTTYVKLLFLSTGAPVVFWGNGGTTLYGATRSSVNVNAAATWTVKAIDTTSTAIRGVKASVSPDDEVAVFFSAASNVASGMKAVLCQTGCNDINNYPAAYVADATNTSTNTYSMGVAWCNDGGEYYPMAFYGSTAAFKLTTCRQSDLSNCSVGGNWGSGTVGAASANRVATDMYVDSSVNNAMVYMIASTTTNVVPYTMANCATQAVAAAWGGTTTGTNFGGVTGTSWLSMDRDATGNFHVSGNEAVNIIRYFNQSTANFTAGAWNAAPATNYPETTGAAGLHAAGLTRGELVVDQASDQVLISYGRRAAVAPANTWGNIVLAYNECPNGVGAPACGTSTLGSSAASTGMWWGNSAVDISGQIQKTSVTWPNVSTAVTSTGIPAVAYVDYSVSGTTEPIAGRLKYAMRNGSVFTAPWSINVIGGTNAPQSPTLAFDENDLPWISWSETPTATVSQKYYLATNSRSDGGGAWTIFNFPAYYAVGAITVQPTMSQATLAMYTVGGVKKPLVAIMSSITSQLHVRAGLFDPATRQWQNVKQVAAFVGTTPGGAYLSADSDASGNVVIAFVDNGTGGTQTNCGSSNRCIRMAYSTNGGSTWTATGTTGVIDGAFTAAKVKLNPANSRPAITYFDRSSGLVRYKHCTTALAGCTTQSNWADLGVGVLEGSGGYSGLVDANSGVLDSGFTFTSEGLPWVVYPRGAGAPANANLMFNYVPAANGVFGGSTALFTNPGSGILPTATANNIALSWNPSSARSNVTGSLHTAFIGPGNFLYMSSCGD